MAPSSDEVPPPLTSSAGSSNSRIPAAMEMIDDIYRHSLWLGECMHASVFFCFIFIF